MIAESANQRVTVRPSIAVVNVRKWSRHPQTPADEQKTGAHPHHDNEYQRPHESLPCDEGTTSTRAIFSMRLAQNSSAISVRYLEPEKASKCRRFAGPRPARNTGRDQTRRRCPRLRCFCSESTAPPMNLPVVPVAPYLVRRSLCYRMWRTHHSPSDSQRNPFVPFTSARICS